METTTKRNKTAVLGAGAWGTALGKLLADRGEQVVLWAREVSVADSINLRAENERYLPAVRLPRNLSATTELADALADADMVVFVVPSHATREVARLAAPHLPLNVPVVSATKGIENGTLMFMDEVLRDALPDPAHRWLTFLSGPSFANELARELPTVVVVAGHEADVVRQVQSRFNGGHLRVYASSDVVGVECGGALKNVIAIAAGAADGLGFGHNTRAALITRGLAEIARLAVARGGSPLTLSGLAGMGDLVLTCTGELSRNRTVGFELGRGNTLEDVLKRLGHVAEGVKTAKSAVELSQKWGIEMPITREVYAALYEGKSARDTVRSLMTRELGHEFDPETVARISPGR